MLGCDICGEVHLRSNYFCLLSPEVEDFLENAEQKTDVKSNYVAVKFAERTESFLILQKRITDDIERDCVAFCSCSYGSQSLKQHKKIEFVFIRSVFKTELVGLNFMKLKICAFQPQSFDEFGDEKGGNKDRTEVTHRRLKG